MYLDIHLLLLKQRNTLLMWLLVFLISVIFFGSFFLSRENH